MGVPRPDADIFSAANKVLATDRSRATAQSRRNQGPERKIPQETFKSHAVPDWTTSLGLSYSTVTSVPMGSMFQTTCALDRGSSTQPLLWGQP
jgi:hypothetical protein